MKIAFVVQRYGLEINGGAELHCRWVAEHMARHWDVEVLTTRAHDYVTWADQYPAGTETINGIAVRRFSVPKPRSPERFGWLQNFILEHEHTERDELAWLEEEGPKSPDLLAFIRSHAAAYDYFIFFSYRYWHSYRGIRAVPGKAILVPTAEHDPVIDLKIFRDLFRLPRAFIYNSEEEREMIQTISGNQAVPGLVVGVGTEVPDDSVAERFRKNHRIEKPYLLYLGRIDQNKGFPQLFQYFLRFKKETGSDVGLVLIGNSILPIPDHPDIFALGFRPEQDKFDALAGAEALIMPSFYESLSMVTLEAWALGRPVIANARCEVLQGQCRRSNGGLTYENYPEFRESLKLLLASDRLRRALGDHGRRYFEANYTWDIIEGKYLEIVSRLGREP
ncbi:MAG: glycosyltransferase family 4 protein [Candidatus Aminicenantes bacterium]|nr:glycosyltransferase family 4 protein [Candidatus Aminicenantes bacterium]